MNKAEFFDLCHVHAREHVSDDYVPSRCFRAGRHEFVRAAETGGVSGGSCWETSNPQPYHVSVEDPGIGKVLDSFLEKHCPGISFLKYRRLVGAVEHREEVEREYYGNRVCYSVWTLSLDTLWQVLEEDLRTVPA